MCMHSLIPYLINLLILPLGTYEEKPSINYSLLILTLLILTLLYAIETRLNISVISLIFYFKA